MSDFWWQVQDQEEQQYEEVLKNDPGYQDFLNKLNQEVEHGHESIRRQRKQVSQSK